MICDTRLASDVPEWQRESSTILGQITFLFLCVPACYLSDLLLQRGAASRFPTMAATAAASSLCSFVVLGTARDCSSAQLTVSCAPLPGRQWPLDPWRLLPQVRMCVYWSFLAFFVPVEPALMVLARASDIARCSLCIKRASHLAAGGALSSPLPRSSEQYRIQYRTCNFWRIGRAAAAVVAML